MKAPRQQRDLDGGYVHPFDEEAGEPRTRPAPGKVTRTSRLPARPGADTRGSGSREEMLTQVLTQRGPGRALPRGLAGQLEDHLGIALGDVRVHDDDRAQAAVRALGVAAFTFGRDIFLGDPGASDLLLAHEAAHAAQHSGATPVASLLGDDVASKLTIEQDDGVEDWADRVAASLFTGARLSVPVAPPAVRFRGGDLDPVAIVARHMGSDEAQAIAMMGRAGSQGRGVVEAAIRLNFEPAKADELIKGASAGGAAPPAVKAQPKPGPRRKGAPPSPLAINLAKAVGAAVGKAVSKALTASLAGDSAPADGVAGKGEGDPIGELGLTLADLDLIHAELIEHERWGGAAATVGAAGSSDRAGFIAQQYGKGMVGGTGTGLYVGAGAGVVSQLAKTYFSKVPGIGAIIAGGFSTIALVNKDWGKSSETIAKFGQGASTYEQLANSIAAVSEVLDIACNIANILAGIVGVISAVMWLVTIITVGVAAPLAVLLSTIALDIVTVAGVIDDVNKSVLQPMVALFRAMHTFTSDADPRDVEASGDGIADATHEVFAAWSAKVGGGLGEKGTEAGVNKVTGKPAPAATTATPGASKADAPKADADAPKADADPLASDVGALSAKARANADLTMMAKGNWKQRVRAGITAVRTQVHANRVAAAEARGRADAAAQAQKDLIRSREVDAERARVDASNAKAAELEAAATARKQQIDAELETKIADLDRAQQPGPDGARRTYDLTVQAAKQTLDTDLQTASQRRDTTLADAATTHGDAKAAASSRYDQVVLARKTLIQESIPRDTLKALNAVDQIPDPKRRPAERAAVLQAHDDAIAGTQGMLTSAQVQKSAELAQADARLAEAQRAAAQTYTDQAAAAQQRHDQLVQAAKDAEIRNLTAAADQQKQEVDGAADAQQSAEVGPAGEAAAQASWADNTAKLTEQQRLEKQALLDEGTPSTRGMVNPEYVQREVFGAQKLEGPLKSVVEDPIKELVGRPPDPAPVEDDGDDAFQPACALGFGVQRVETARVNPAYADPPAVTVPHLAELRAGIEADLALAAEAERDRLRMQVEQAAHQGNQGRLTELAAQSAEADSAVALHQAAVERKQTAIAEQKARQDQNEGLFGSWGQKQIGFEPLLISLEAFNQFTWIGAELGSSDFQQMYDDGVRFKGQIAAARLQMTTETGKQPASKLKILDNEGIANTTEQQDVQSVSNLDQASAKREELTGLNQQSTEEALAAKNQAAADQLAKTAAAAAKKAMHQQMAQQLKGWAVDHRETRASAQAEQVALLAGEGAPACGSGIAIPEGESVELPDEP